MLDWHPNFQFSWRKNGQILALVSIAGLKILPESYISTPDPFNKLIRFDWFKIYIRSQFSAQIVDPKLTDFICDSQANNEVRTYYYSLAQYKWVTFQYFLVTLNVL
jgi:hypothetical protein